MDKETDLQRIYQKDLAKFKIKQGKLLQFQQEAFSKAKFICIVIVVSVLAIVRIQNGQVKWADWSGFGNDVEISRTTEQTPGGEITKRTVTEKIQSGKTLWDFLGVLGVPLVLTILGFWFQQLQQERVDEALKEEVLQAYFDRLSEFLIDKNTIIMAAKHNKAVNSSSDEVTDEQKELIDATQDVIRARTLSILRRLRGDGERKASVIRFLIETGLMSKLQISLSDADLSLANLCDIDLYGANLEFATLINTNLHSANLSNTNLKFANLYGADLRNANLHGADLHGAELRSTILNEETKLDEKWRLVWKIMNEGATGIFINADLSNADLSRSYLGSSYMLSTHYISIRLNGVNFSGADLSGANLNGIDFSGANFSGTNLSNAELINANLSSANFSGANLSGANLSGANLSSADVRSAKNLIESQLIQAKLCKTELPEGIKLDPNRNCKELSDIMP